jgi:hypothetical protein
LFAAGGIVAGVDPPGTPGYVVPVKLTTRFAGPGTDTVFPVVESTKGPFEYATAQAGGGVLKAMVTLSMQPATDGVRLAMTAPEDVPPPWEGVVAPLKGQSALGALAGGRVVDRSVVEVAAFVESPHPTARRPANATTMTEAMRGAGMRGS